jgi:hypothetical protein
MYWYMYQYMYKLTYQRLPNHQRSQCRVHALAASIGPAPVHGACRRSSGRGAAVSSFELPFGKA